MNEMFWISGVPFLFGLAAFFEPYTSGIHNKFLKRMDKLKAKQFKKELFLFLFSRTLFFCLYGGMLAVLRYYLWFFVSPPAIGIGYIALALASFIYSLSRAYPTINLLEKLNVPMWVTYAAVVPSISLPLCIALSLFIFLTGIVGVGIFTMMMFAVITSLPILLLLFFPQHRQIWARPAKVINRYHIANALLAGVGCFVLLTNL